MQKLTWPKKCVTLILHLQASLTEFWTESTQVPLIAYFRLLLTVQLPILYIGLLLLTLYFQASLIEFLEEGQKRAYAHFSPSVVRPSLISFQRLPASRKNWSELILYLLTFLTRPCMEGVALLSLHSVFILPPKEQLLALCKNNLKITLLLLTFFTAVCIKSLKMVFCYSHSFHSLANSIPQPPNLLRVFCISLRGKMIIELTPFLLTFLTELIENSQKGAYGHFHFHFHFYFFRFSLTSFPQLPQGSQLLLFFSILLLSLKAILYILNAMITIRQNLGAQRSFSKIMDLFCDFSTLLNSPFVQYGS